MLMVNISFEIVFTALMYCLLGRWKENSLHVMCSVVKTNFVDFLAAMEIVTLYLCMMQHTQFGMDTLDSWIGAQTGDFPV